MSVDGEFEFESSKAGTSCFAQIRFDSFTANYFQHFECSFVLFMFFYATTETPDDDDGRPPEPSCVLNSFIKSR